MKALQIQKKQNREKDAVSDLVGAFVALVSARARSGAACKPSMIGTYACDRISHHDTLVTTASLPLEDIYSLYGRSPPVAAPDNSLMRRVMWWLLELPVFFQCVYCNTLKSCVT